MHVLNTLCLRVVCADTDCETDLRIGRGLYARFKQRCVCVYFVQISLWDKLRIGRNTLCSRVVWYPDYETDWGLVEVLNTLCLCAVRADTDFETDYELVEVCMRVINTSAFVCCLCRYKLYMYACKSCQSYNTLRTSVCTSLYTAINPHLTPPAHHMPFGRHRTKPRSGQWFISLVGSHS